MISHWFSPHCHSWKISQQEDGKKVGNQLLSLPWTRQNFPVGTHRTQTQSILNTAATMIVELLPIPPATNFWFWIVESLRIALILFSRMFLDKPSFLGEGELSEKYQITQLLLIHTHRYYFFDVIDRWLRRISAFHILEKLLRWAFLSFSVNLYNKLYRIGDFELWNADHLQIHIGTFNSASFPRNADGQDERCLQMEEVCEAEGNS